MVAQGDGSGGTRRGVSRRELFGLGALLAVSVLIRLPLLGGAQIDYDEGVYWESLRSMAAGHPLFTSVYSSQPPGFLLLVAPFFAIAHSLAAARSAMLVCFAVAVVATYCVARMLLGVRAALLAAVLLCVDPLMLRQSVTLQADGPAVALGMVALALAVAATRPRASARTGVLAAAAGAELAAAVLVKLLAAAFVVPVVLVFFLAPGTARGRAALGDVLTHTACAAAGAAAAGAAVLLPFAGVLRVALSQFVGSHLSARTLHEGGLTHDMAIALARESPFYLAGIAGIALLLWRAPRTGAVVAAWAAAVAALALTQHPLWPHHLVLAAPLIAVAAVAAAALIRRRFTLPAAGVAAAALAAAGLATGFTALDHPFTADTLPAAQALLRSIPPPGEVITDDQFAVADAGRDTPPELVDTSFVRIDSEPLRTSTIEAIAQRDHVVAFYTGTGRFPHIAGLLDWVRLHYPRVTPVPGGGLLFTAA